MLASDIQCYSLLAILAIFAGNASGATRWPYLQFYLMEFTTDTSGANWWPNLQLIQVAPPGGQIYN